MSSSRIHIRLNSSSPERIPTAGSSPVIVSPPTRDNDPPSDDDVPHGEDPSSIRLQPVPSTPKRKKRTHRRQKSTTGTRLDYDSDSDDPNRPRIRWSNDGGTPLRPPPSLSIRRPSTTGSEFFWSRDAERRVVRRMDMYLVGFMTVLYTLAFLDRSNIGNARLAGMEEDLRLTPAQFEWCLSAFYIAYISFEWATLLWRVFTPRKYVALTVTAWGICACGQALTTGFTGMVILRFLLGVAEACFSPGVPFYLSHFYRPEELAFRVGLFISAAPLATAYAGALAWVITKFSGSIAPWRMLFVVEGWPTVVMGVVSWWWVPEGPGGCWWLGWEERGIARRRLLVVKEGGEQQGEEEDKGGIKWREVWGAVCEGKNWVMAFMFFACNIAFASLPIFLPTIISTYGFSPLASQALSAPPYLLSFLSILLITHLSDRFRSRSPFLIASTLIASFCYMLLSFPLPNAAKYALIYPLTSALFVSISLLIPWLLNTSRTSSSKGAGMVLLNLIGQLGPLVGTRVYPESDGPGYERGMRVCAAAMLAAGLGAVVVRWMVRRRGGELGGVV